MTEDPGSSQQFPVGSTDRRATTARLWWIDLATGAPMTIARRSTRRPTKARPTSTRRRQATSEPGSRAASSTRPRSSDPARSSSRSRPARSGWRRRSWRRRTTRGRQARLHDTSATAGSSCCFAYRAPSRRARAGQAGGRPALCRGGRRSPARRRRGSGRRSAPARRGTRAAPSRSRVDLEHGGDRRVAVDDARAAIGGEQGVDGRPGRRAASGRRGSRGGRRPSLASPCAEHRRRRPGDLVDRAAEREVGGRVGVDDEPVSFPARSAERREPARRGRASGRRGPRRRRR